MRPDRRLVAREAIAATALTRATVRSGAFLLARQLIGAVLAFFGMLALTRLLGPERSGVYFTAFGIVFFVQNVARLGLDVFLLRAPGQVDKAALDQIFALLGGLGIAAGGLVAAASPLLAGALRMPAVEGPILAMAATIPVMHLYRVPLARLEREIAFGRIGIAELAAQALFFAVAIPAAVAGFGAYAPVLGWWAQQLAMLVACFRLAGYRPGFAWSPALAREALAHGSLVMGSILIQSLRSLIVPVVVGGTQGPAAVGIVALAVRLVETLSMARTVLARIAVPLLGRLAGDRRRLLATLRLGIEAQTVAVAAPVTLFSLLGGELVPRLFGPGWQEVAQMVTLLAPSAIVGAVFSLHAQLLMTEARPRPLVATQAAATALAWLAAAALVPRLGAAGYACAELAAAVAWIIPARLVARRFGRVGYGPAFVWAAAAGTAAIAPLVSWWLLLSLPALALHPATRRAVRDLTRAVRGCTGNR